MLIQMMQQMFRKFINWNQVQMLILAMSSAVNPYLRGWGHFSRECEIPFQLPRNPQKKVIRSILKPVFQVGLDWKGQSNMTLYN